MKLHLGCGKRNFGPDWIHIDGGNFDHVSSHDITKLPFKNNSADIIYASHVIEYFDREEVIPVLKEWKRVLCGTLRIAVPDFQAMTRLYIDYELESFLGPLYGKMKMGDKYIYHKTVYDFQSLNKLLKSIGFKNIRLYDWQDTEHAMYDDHSQAYLPKMNKNGNLISLNVECDK